MGKRGRAKNAARHQRRLDEQEQAEAGDLSKITPRHYLQARACKSSDKAPGFPVTEAFPGSFFIATASDGQVWPLEIWTPNVGVSASWV